jgi:hypothetical protein
LLGYDDQRDGSATLSTGGAVLRLGQPRAGRDARLDACALNGPALAARRLANLRLAGGALDDWRDVVRSLGAVQSQDYPGGKWSIGQRTARLQDAELDAALASGALIRTHVLRPTWHFVLPSDVRWLLALTGPRVHQLSAYYYRQAGLAPDVLRQSDALLARTLERGPHTRVELQAALAQAGVAVNGPSLAFVLMHAELEAVVCSGPLRGKQHTYALLDERVPAAPVLSRDEAVVELTRRYFTSHGPATTKDFRWWSSLPESDAKRALNDLHAEHERIDSTTYYWLDTPAGPVTAHADPTAFLRHFHARPAGPSSPHRVHLLQAYDEYFVGYGSQTRYVLDLSRAASKHANTSRVFSHVVVLDGDAAGRWKRTASTSGVVVEADLFGDFDEQAMAELQAEVEALGRFLGEPATLRLI